MSPPDRVRDHFVALVSPVSSNHPASQRPESVATTWPHGVSTQPSMRISDVLGALRSEFPAVSHSKLRFLEDQGLITPTRSSGGYRQYSPADVERLRFVLTEQRDRYLPLKVIKEKLADLDSGTLRTDHPIRPRVASADGMTPVEAAVAEFADLAGAAGVEHSFVEGLISAGVLRAHPATTRAADIAENIERDVRIIKLAEVLERYGIDWRHLRSMRAAADRQVAIIDQSVAYIQSRRTESSQGEADSVRRELAETLANLHAVWLRDGVAELS